VDNERCAWLVGGPGMARAHRARAPGFSPTLLVIGVLAVAAGSAASLLGASAPSAGLSTLTSSLSLEVELLLVISVACIVGVIAKSLPDPAPPSSAIDDDLVTSMPERDNASRARRRGSVKPRSRFGELSKSRGAIATIAVAALLPIGLFGGIGLALAHFHAGPSPYTSSGGGSNGVGGSGGAGGSSGSGGSGGGGGSGGSGGSGSGSGSNGTGGNGSGNGSSGGSGGSGSGTGGGSGSGSGGGSGGSGSSSGGSSGSGNGTVGLAAARSPPFSAWPVFVAVIGAALVVVTIVVPGLATHRIRMRGSAPAPASQAARIEVSRVFREAASNLTNATDPRSVIVQLYARLMARLEPAVEIASSRTPEEIRRVHLIPLGVRPRAAERLTRLFEEACYSSHSMGVDTLEVARESIQVAEYDLRASRAFG